MPDHMNAALSSLHAHVEASAADRAKAASALEAADRAYRHAVVTLRALAAEAAKPPSSRRSGLGRDLPWARGHVREAALGVVRLTPGSSRSVTEELYRRAGSAPVGRTLTHAAQQVHAALMACEKVGRARRVYGEKCQGGRAVTWHAVEDPASCGQDIAEAASSAVPEVSSWATASEVADRFPTFRTAFEICGQFQLVLTDVRTLCPDLVDRIARGAEALEGNIDWWAKWGGRLHAAEIETLELRADGLVAAADLDDDSDDLEGRVLFLEGAIARARETCPA